MRWFHVTKKGVPSQNLSSQERGNIGVQKGNGDDSTKGVNFPMNLHVTHRKYRKLNKSKIFNFFTVCAIPLLETIFFN